MGGQKEDDRLNFTDMKGVISTVSSGLFTSELENIQENSRQFFYHVW